MTLSAKNIIRTVLPIAVLLISNFVSAQEQPKGDQTSGAEQELSAPVPDLADIVPLATELTGLFADLENKVPNVVDVSEVEKKYIEIESHLKRLPAQFQRLKDSKDYSYNKFVELRDEIKQENVLLEEAGKPVDQSIRQLGAWREEWLSKKKRWDEWQSSLHKEGALDQLKPTFKKANDTIEKAMGLILPKLEEMLEVQKKAGDVHAGINSLTVELEGLISQKRREDLLGASPPMFSSRYFSQFGIDLWRSAQKSFQDISWPGSRFLARQGWIVLIQVIITLFVIAAVYRDRKVWMESKRWHFFAVRPFSAGLFMGFMATLGIYEYEGVPASWKLAYTILGGLTFARLAKGLTESSWKGQFVYGLMIVLIINSLMDVMGFPLPLFRLYTVLTALVGLISCLRWAKESRRHQEWRLYPFLLRSWSLFFAFIVISELWGKQGVSSYLFVSLIDSTGTVLVFMLFMYMLHGGIEWLLRISPLRRAAVLHSDDMDAIIRRIANLTDLAICVLILLPAVLLIWGAYDSLEAATKGLLSLGFNLGSQRISVGLMIVSAGILYVSILTSWILRKLLMDEVLIKGRLEKGVRFSIGRLIHYILIIVGFLLALSTLGFEITKITILLGALGVGIGFGLQGIVNNFVSGLILLFERPVRVGDYIVIGGNWSEIKKIGLRATTVQTFDQADVIIPNADLVTSQVTNWTLSSRRVRLIIPVGVAYGSDVSLVVEKLMECAKENPMVAERPEPQVLFLSFGESSLDFELRAWVPDADDRLAVISQLHHAIDRKFREAKIEIAFPQRDLHLRTVDESVTLRPSETTG